MGIEKRSQIVSDVDHMIEATQTLLAESYRVLARTQEKMTSAQSHLKCVEITLRKQRPL